jgi:hypothetical protein
MKLSVTMIEAIEYATEHQNKLIRHQGGFWADANWNNSRKWFGTKTVEALVSRGYATYTKWQERKGGFNPFPVEATLTEKAGI